MHKHPEAGYKIVKRIDFLKNAAEPVTIRRQRLPARPERGKHPLGARLFAIADVFDALKSDRPYHCAMSYDEAVGVIAAGSGSHFDPDAVATFLAIALNAWDTLRNQQELTISSTAIT